MDKIQILPVISIAFAILASKSEMSIYLLTFRF